LNFLNILNSNSKLKYKMFAGDYNSAVGANMAGNDFSAAPKLINGKPRVI
jgi:hypothetical protein